MKMSQKIRSAFHFCHERKAHWTKSENFSGRAREICVIQWQNEWLMLHHFGQSVVRIRSFAHDINGFQPLNRHPLKLWEMQNNHKCMHGKQWMGWLAALFLSLSVEGFTSPSTQTHISIISTISQKRERTVRQIYSFWCALCVCGSFVFRLAWYYSTLRYPNVIHCLIPFYSFHLILFCILLSLFAFYDS